MQYQDLPRLSAEQIAHYAGFLNFEHDSPDYFYNLQAPGLNYDDSQAVAREIVRRQNVAKIEAMDTTPAIKAYMLANVAGRGTRHAERADETAFFKRCLERSCNAHGRALDAYKPEKGACGVKLQPALGVLVSTHQEAYSDDSYVAIPYVVTEGRPADMAVFARNVSALVRRGDTHTGMAGSGCNYDVAVHDGFVVLHCRASIAD